MALRSDTEHSYRTLALQVLAERVCKDADSALIGQPPLGKDATPAQTIRILHEALQLANLKFAMRWLSQLDEKLCPEVEDLEQQLFNRIKGGEAPDVVLADAVKLLESIAIQHLKGE